MFEQSLVEITQETRKRKRWTALLSFSMEATAVLVLLSFPLVHTEVLTIDDHPTFHAPTRYVPPHVVVVASVRPVLANVRQAALTVFQQPSRIPTNIDRSPDPPTPQYAVAAKDGLPDGAIYVSDPRAQNPVLAEMMKPSVVAHHTVAPVARTSSSQEGLLIRQIKPAYPEIAKRARIQGTVLLHAIISREGAIEQLQVVSGPPLLINSAVEAVKQWRYRPYFLNGEPLAVETQITVNFTLNGQ